MHAKIIVICIVTLLACIASTGFAAPPDRRSDVGFLFEAGKNGYQSNNLNFDLGLNPDWQLNFSVNTQKSDGVTTASLFQAGANTYLSPGWRARFGLKSDREPNSINGDGVYVGTGWIVSDLWSANLATEIIVDGSVLQYRQGSDRIIQRLRGTTVPFSSLSIGVSQELSQVVQISATFTGYGYGGSSPEDLTEAISSRLVVPPGLFQLLDGLPKSTVELSAVILAGNFAFSPTLSNSTLAYEEKVNGISLTTDYDFNRSWSMTLDLAGSSSSSNFQSGLLGLGTTYKW